MSFPFVPGHEVVGDLDDGTPGRARAGARLRHPRHRPAVPGLRRRRPRPLRAHRLRRTSSPACRPASAATPAAAGRRSWSPTRASSTPCPTTCPTRPPSWSSRPPAPCTPRSRPSVDRRRRRRRDRRRHPRAAHHRRAAPLTPTPARSSPPPSTRSSARWPASSAPTVVVEPDELARAVRRVTGSLRSATATSAHRRRRRRRRLRRQRGQSLAQASRSSRPGGPRPLVGMPGARARRPHQPVAPRDHSSPAPTPTAPRRCSTARRGRTFDLAFELVRGGRPRPARVRHLPPRPLPDAIEHAATAGRRGAVKIAFDLRDEKERNR